MSEPRRRSRIHRLARRVPGAQALVGEVRLRRAMRQGLVTLDYPGAAIRMRASTRQIARLRLSPVAKEPWTVEWIEANLVPGDVLWDVGANVGDYTLIAAKRCPEARIVAAEPAFANFASLCENLLLNGASPNVVPLPVALADGERLGSLGLSDVAAGAAVHTLDASAAAYAQPVLVHTLDGLVARFGLPAPTLVKLDVDGAEPAVLAGARETLRRPELRSLIVEVEEENGQAVVAALAEAGLVLGSRFEERDGVRLPGVWYGIFERV